MDLQTSYLGLTLKNPLVPSSSPLTRDLHKLRQMEDAGASAVVLYSLFAEQVDMKHGRDQAPAADAAVLRDDPDDYLAFIGKAKSALEIPVIASLNCGGMGSWVEYARHIEAAGADALELNIYFIPADPDLTAVAIEEFYIDVLYQVKSALSIPVAIKLSPYFTSLANVAQRLVSAGADGLVLFNRFYQPDPDVETEQVIPRIELSTSSESRLPLRWIALLYGRVSADLALTTGVHTVVDVVKGVAVGAAVTMMASELLQHGIGRLNMLHNGLVDWLTEHNYHSLNQLRGRLSLVDENRPITRERANYLRVLSSYSPGDPWRFGAFKLQQPPAEE